MAAEVVFELIEQQRHRPPGFAPDTRQHFGKSLGCGQKAFVGLVSDNVRDEFDKLCSEETALPVVEPNHDETEVAKRGGNAFYKQGRHAQAGVAGNDNEPPRLAVFENFLSLFLPAAEHVRTTVL